MSIDQADLPLVDVYRHRMLMERKLRAAQKLCAERTIKVVAHDLDQIWGPLGHAVSASTLSNALRDHERSYWRSEWDSYFADHSDEFRDVIAEMAGKAKPKKTKEELFDALVRLLPHELASKRVEALLKKAEAE